MPLRFGASGGCISRSPFAVSPVARPISESLQEYARGVGGGLLFSLPLFYTMEVWQAGASASPARLVAIVVGTFGLLIAYNQVAGIRVGHTWGEVLLESVEEMGLGLAVAAGLLMLLGRFPIESFSHEALGLLTLEGMVAAIGVSVGTAQLGQTPDDADDDDGADDPEEDDDADEDDDEMVRGAAGELTLAMCGAVLIASNVAPTEEVLLLGAQASAVALGGIVALSLAVGGGILYVSAFRGSDAIAGLDVGPIGGTLVTYAVSVVASAVMLWALGFNDSTGAALGPLIVLSFPAMLGAAAGRLLLAPD